MAGSQGAASLDRRFLGPELAESYRFAAGRERDEESLASEDDPYVAVVHADGNAVGRFIDSLVATAGERDGAAEVFRRFSDALSQATREAANEAVREVLVRDFEATSKLEEQGRRKPNTNSGRLPILKARPIVLGGDDLTIILKARLAFDFTERFLEAFERTTRAQLACFGVPGFEGLTASAGLAITKEKFPFDRAYELAESLCIQAKRHAKRETDALSTLAFHRVTTSLPQDAATVLEHELTRGGRRLTFEAYRTGVRSAESVASFDALRRLAAALPNDQRGGFRGLLAQLRRSPDRAEEAFLRMCEVRRRRRASETTERLRAALCELNGEGRLLWRKDPESDLLRTPLLDAHVVALTHRAAGAGERR